MGPPAQWSMVSLVACVHMCVREKKEGDWVRSSVFWTDLFVWEIVFLQGNSS